MNKRRFTAAVLVGISSLFGAVAIAPAPAQAATDWTLSGTSADLSGAWVHGTWWWGGDGRLYVRVEVKDTVANAKNASADLLAIYSDNGSRGEQLVAGGGVGSTAKMTYDFAPNVTKVYVNECVDNATSYEVCADAARIF